MMIFLANLDQSPRFGSRRLVDQDEHGSGFQVRERVGLGLRVTCHRVQALVLGA